MGKGRQLLGSRLIDGRSKSKEAGLPFNRLHILPAQYCNCLRKLISVLSSTAASPKLDAAPHSLKPTFMNSLQLTFIWVDSCNFFLQIYRSFVGLSFIDFENTRNIVVNKLHILLADTKSKNYSIFSFFIWRPGRQAGAQVKLGVN